MRLNARSRRLPILWRVLMCLFVLGAAPSLAQEGPAPGPATPAPQPAQPAEPAEIPENDKGEDLGPMSIELDLQRLIFDNQSASLQDPVWRLSPRPGKRILLLPFTVDNVHRANKLSRFPITVRTGRFIGFVIPKPVATNRSSDSIDLNRVIRAAPGALQQMLFEQEDRDGVEGQATNNSPSEDQAMPTPDNAPRLAREITLHPDGTVRWEMDRSITGGEVQSASEQNLYAYKIDAEQLRAAQPEKAERITRNDGEDSRTYALRKREHQLAERDKQNAYRELRDNLRELPESFSEARPSVLYAAIEVPDNQTLGLQGPDPLPWTLDEAKRELFDQLARGNVFQEDNGAALAGRAVTMIKSHPLDARAIAIATMRSKLAGQVTSGDPGYEVLTRLLQSNDQATRRIALYGVATITPPTLASAKLVGVAGEAALGEERKMLSFASLSKLLSTQGDDPDNASTLIEQVGQAITDPEGPSAPRIIETVLASLDPSANAGRRQPDPVAVAVMVKTLDLSGVGPDESAGVITAILQHAPTNPVAAGWLDHKLLGSTDQQVVNQTLAQLVQSQIKAPQSENAESLGTPDLDLEPVPASEPDAEQVPDEEQTTEPAPAQEAGPVQLNGTIPMAREDHALLGLFESGDDLQQAAAWKALGRFHLALPAADNSNATPVPNGQPAQALRTPALVLLDAVLAKATAREKTPASIVAFIVNQQDPALTKPANDRFVALLASPDLGPEASSAALAAYLATPEWFTEAITSAKSEDKRQLMESMYRAQDQNAPLMAGMIADNGNTLRWLTEHINEHDQLPTNDDWAELAMSQGESGLLSSAGSSDNTLSAAAAAALVVQAGGDEKQQQSFAQTVGLMQARTAQEVQKQWEQQRAKIFAAAFKRAAGTYKLVATLRQSADPSVEPEAITNAKRIELGLVQLRAEGVELSLSVEAVTLSPSPDRLGIRIDKPASLRTFDKPELSKIPPDHLTQPIDLLPQDGGSWSGETALRDGRTLSVSLEPAG